MERRLANWLAVAVVALGTARAQPGSLFADPRAARIGDALTVLIQENARATNTTSTNTDKENQLQITSAIPGGNNLLRFVPLHNLDSDIQNQYDAKSQTSRSAMLTARISVTVVGKKPNGDLIIEGVRRLKVNGETEAIYLSGSVSPPVIRADNTVLSSSIADLNIEYTGKGSITQGSRPGIFTRLLNWIF